MAVFFIVLLHHHLLLADAILAIPNVVDHVVELFAVEALREGLCHDIHREHLVLALEVAAQRQSHLIRAVDLALDRLDPVIELADLAIVLVHAVVLCLVDSVREIRHFRFHFRFEVFELAFVHGYLQFAISNALILVRDLAFHHEHVCVDRSLV